MTHHLLSVQHLLRWLYSLNAHNLLVFYLYLFMPWRSIGIMLSCGTSHGSSHLVLFKAASFEESSRYSMTFVERMHLQQVELLRVSKGRITFNISNLGSYTRKICFFVYGTYSWVRTCQAKEEKRRWGGYADASFHAMS